MMKPKLKRAGSFVAICAVCGAWQGRYPTFMFEFGKGYQCGTCGATSINVRQGRPFGPRSRRWKGIEAAFDWCWNSIHPMDTEVIESLTTEPPLKEMLTLGQRVEKR